MRSPDQTDASKVQSLLDKTAAISLNELLVTESQADAVIAKRLRRLEIFTRPGTPADLCTAFSDAADLTKSCHDFAKLLLLRSSQLGSLPRYSDIELYFIARKALDRNVPARLKQPDMVSIHDRVLATIVGTKNSSKDETLGQAIEHAFCDSSEFEKMIAKSEADLLFAGRQVLQTSTFAIDLSSTISDIARGVFYLVVVGEAGSKLENYAVSQKVRGVVRELAATVSGIGDIITPINMLLDVMAALFDKERALVEMQSVLAEPYSAAKTYVETYVEGLATWAGWSAAVADGMRSSQDLYLKHFLNET